jgi:flagellin-like protein
MNDVIGTRGASPVVGNILMVAVVIVIAVLLITLSLTFLEGTGTPTAEASFEYERTAAGLQMTPQALGTDVIVQLNGQRVTTFDAGSAGKSRNIPTAPGDRITVITRDGERSALVEKEIDDRSEIGDFVAYYTFDSGGTTVTDRAGNGNTGTLEDDDGGSGPTWAGCGLNFDGQNDHVFVNYISSPESVNEFTFATTYVQQSGGSGGSVSQLVEHRWSGNEWFLETDGGNPYRVDYAVEFPSATISSPETYEYGERHTVVGTYDGSEYTLYVDGQQVATDTHERAVNMGDMRFGRDFESGDQYFDGTICEARLYYTAFDESQVDTLVSAMSG